ncbi:MAG: peroxiredoxin family protein [Planctomycetales bacterium]
MQKRLSRGWLLMACLALCALLLAPFSLQAAGKIPAVGTEAPDFTLKDLDGDETSLSDMTKHGSVMLVVLRGYPRAQSPPCKKQFAELTAMAKELSKKRIFLVFVYPGEAEDLEEHAKEFLGDQDLARNVYLLLDPDFEFTSAYGLRWNASLETSYPTTFLIDREGIVRYKRVSRTHGGRPWPEQIHREIAKLEKTAK